MNRNPSFQIEVFSRILKTSVTTFLNSDEENLQKNMEECAKMVCHGQHTYVYAQVGIHGYLGSVSVHVKDQQYKQAKHCLT